MESDLKTTYISIAIGICILLAIIFISSCTYSITQVHTQGQASDVVDETATNTPSTTVSPTFKLPAAAIL